MVIDLGDTWGAIGVALALASAILGVWWRLQMQITENVRRIDKKACKRELAQLEVNIAKGYVTKETLHETERRIFHAIEGIEEGMKELNKKIDRLLLGGRDD